MSSHELEHVEVMGRVKSGDLKLIDAAEILELSCRQVKRVADAIVRRAARG